MEIIIPDQVADQITNRGLRCYQEQHWYGKNFLFDFIGDINVQDKHILEIGCAEAGLLKFYQDKGANCSGLELSDVRYNNAVLLNDSNRMNIFQADICDPKSYSIVLQNKYDLIIIRDVIEHIKHKEKALKNIYNLLKPNGKLFVSFPPKYCAYAGHQQTIPVIFGKLPYIHLLPNFLYERYLYLIRCPDHKIKYLLRTKQTRVSIYKMRKILAAIGFNIIKETKWFLRPAYSFRFGLPKLKNRLSIFPIFNEIFTNGVLYLLEKPEA